MPPPPDSSSAAAGPHAASPSRGGSLPALPDASVLATIGRFTTRYPGSAFLDMLALRASGGTSDATGLVARARSGDLEGTDHRDLAWFGYVLAAEPAGRATLDDVADILDHALAAGPDVGSKVRGLWLQVLLLTGRLDGGTGGPTQHQVDADEWWAVTTDLLNPYRTSGHQAGRGTEPDADQLRWLESLSRPFTDEGFEALRLDEGPGVPFDRLATDPVASTGGELVSVVVPVYDPGPSLVTSVRSLLAQSWTDVEVLLCDDGSTRGGDLIDRCAGLDARVTVLRLPRNEGAYSAMNLGLTHAKGRYVTFQGADDFSHPRRIEEQVGAFEGGQGVVASLAHTLRTSQTLQVTGLGLRKIALNMSSLLVVREPVVDALGGFDRVRRSGDREFLERIRATFGSDSVVTMTQPLSVVQLTPGSLSRGDMGFLRRHAARQAYATTAAAWHREISRGRESPHLVLPRRAPFPAPDYIAAGSASGDAGGVDVAILANPASNAPTDLGPLVEALCEGGLRVGVLEFLGPRDACQQPQVPGDQLAALLRSGRARWVLPGEHVRARVGLVHDPAAVLTMPVDRLQEAQVDDLVLVADRVGDHDAAAVAERAGSGRVHWLPANDAVAQAVRAAVPDASVLPAAPWLVAPVVLRPSEPASIPAVVGLAPARFGDRAARTAWDRSFVPRDESSQVWGFGRGPGRRAGREVTRVGPPEVGWADFLEQVDYLAVPPEDPARLTTAVLDAWARGVVVLAPDALRPHLGPAAEYPEAAGVDACLAAHRADPGRYRSVQGNATEWMRRHATPEALRATYDMILRECVGR